MLGLSILVGTTSGLQVCPGTPANASAPVQVTCAGTCCPHSYFGDGSATVAGWGCSSSSSSSSSSSGGTCCAPGPKEPPSATLPNCLIIGDSVSEGYLPHVASALATTCKVQHGPWCGGGSAGNVAGALPCVRNWLRSAMNVPVNWDVVHFNFGLHDWGDNSSAALALYQQHLDAVTAILTEQPGRVRAAQYALTTPYMPMEVNASDPIIAELNARATAVMAAHAVPVVDLYARVKEKCGQTYTSCPGFCDSAGPGGTCTFHYTAEGYAWIATPVVEGIVRLLNSSSARGARLAADNEQQQQQQQLTPPPPRQQRPAFGAFDPVFTPFFANASLNLGAIPSYAAWTHSSNTDTIILGGSTGEWPSMSSGERIATLVAWRAALDALPPRAAPPATRPKPLLLFHAGDVGVRRAAKLAAAAEANGADALLIVAPCIMRPATLEMLVQVIGTVAAAAPSLPAWYYHYPKLYTVDFSMADFLAAASAKVGGIPNLAGVKYIDSNWTDLEAATALGGGRYELVTTQLVTPSLTNYSTAGSIVYTPASSFVNAGAREFAAGNLSGAAFYDERVKDLYAVFKKHGGTKGVARAAAGLFAPGLDLGPPRVPLVGVAAALIQGLRQDLVAAGFDLPPATVADEDESEEEGENVVAQDANIDF